MIKEKFELIFCVNILHFKILKFGYLPKCAEINLKTYYIMRIEKNIFNIYLKRKYIIIKYFIIMFTMP